MKGRILKENEVFGNYTILEYKGIIKGTNHYLCQCKCGEKIILRYARIVTKPYIHKNCRLNESKLHFNIKYSPQDSSFRAKYTNYKASAKNRGLEFTLSDVETINLLKGNCFYCNSKPNNKYNAIIRNRKYKTSFNHYKLEEYDILYNGIDRINSKKGYTLDNTVSCCSTCNTAKLNMSLEDFKTWIIKIYNNLIKKYE